jgi:ferredoxin
MGITRNHPIAPAVVCLEWPALDFWLELNRKYSEIWLNITKKKPAPPDADAFVNVPDKYAKYFSPNPGEGD